jgi:[NiFe] hydrogenase diaphorase moiety large subunit
MALQQPRECQLSKARSEASHLFERAMKTPVSPHPKEKTHGTISGACAKSRHLLNILHELQQENLHVSSEASQEVAAHLGLPIAQVRSVVEFYSFFHASPRGRYNILLSNCTSCGYDAEGKGLFQILLERLHVAPGKTREDGTVSIDETSCIGMCDFGSSMLVNGLPITRLDVARIMQIADLVEARIPLSEWPSAWFEVESSIRKRGLLLADDSRPGDAIRATLMRGAEAALSAIISSGLRGRGGAGFATGLKWKLCREAKGHARYVVCNADEGEPGTFKDRVLLQGHADMVFEGMTVCALVLGAARGYLYLRGEYRYLLPHLLSVLARRRDLGLLGQRILGDERLGFDIEIVTGAGAYICGEESALIESLEGKRGIPRNRPPFPVTNGYLGQPTVVNNVETFLAAANIALRGSNWFRETGTQESPGSKILSVSGDCGSPGVYEYPFGVGIRQILDDSGSKDVQAVQVGGPSGTLIGSDEFDRQLAFEDLATGGSLMLFGRDRDLLSCVRNFAHFFAHESCGFCTPCRVGTTLMKNALEKVWRGHGTQPDVDDMKRVSAIMRRHSHCGLGHTAANPFLDLMQRFPQALNRRLATTSFEPYFDLDGALEEARQITRRDDAAAHLK